MKKETKIESQVNVTELRLILKSIRNIEGISKRTGKPFRAMSVCGALVFDTSPYYEILKSLMG